MAKRFTWKRILSIVISLAVIAYIAFQIYSAYHSTIRTESALSYTYYETVPVNGLIVRREQVLTGGSDGVVTYCTASGSKIAAGHVVARVFENSDQAAIQTRIDEIDDVIANLKTLQTDATQVSANAQTIDSKINETLNRLLRVTDSGTTVGFSAASDELIRYLSKKQMVLGTAADFNNYLNQLTDERNTLEASLRSYTEISADDSGYFVNEIDGYENLIGYADVKDLTVDDLEKVMQKDVRAGSGIGKMITSNEWYLLAVVDNAVSQTLAIGGTVTITIPLLSDEAYSCTITAMNVDYASGRTAMIVSCGQMNANLAHARKVSAEIRMHTYRGLRVHQSALRVVDGITGVYVVNGIAAAFKPVDLLYSDAGFSICAYDSTKSGGLKMYDEVITEGSDLYDGKIIR